MEVGFNRFNDIDECRLDIIKAEVIAWDLNDEFIDIDKVDKESRDGTKFIIRKIK